MLFLAFRELENKSGRNCFVLWEGFLFIIEESNVSSKANDKNICECEPECFLSQQNPDAINWKTSLI